MTPSRRKRLRRLFGRLRKQIQADIRRHGRRRETRAATDAGNALVRVDRMLDKVSRAEGETDWQQIDVGLVRFIKWKQGH